jgi:hypothetical protein
MKIRLICMFMVFLCILAFSAGCISENADTKATTAPVETIQPESNSEYQMFVNDLLGFEKDGKCGFMDKTGKEVIPPKYDWIGDFSQGLACVLEGDWETGTWGFIDPDGNYVIPSIYSDALSFDESGLAPVEKDDIWGYINTKGEYVIEPQYQYAYNFSENGMAKVTVDDKYGFIDQTGAFVIQPEFDEVYDFDNGYAVVFVGEWETGKYGYIDEKGNYLVEPQYDQAYNFTKDGYAMVVKDDKCGLIDTTGTLVIPCEYDYFHGNFPGMAEM